MRAATVGTPVVGRHGGGTRPARPWRDRLRPCLPRPATATVLLAAAIVVGAVLRFADLGGVPPALNQDEAVYGYDAYSLLQTGRDHLGHPFPFTSLETFGDWSSPLLSYLSIPAVALFGLRAEVLRGVSAALGVAAIPILYLLARVLFDRRAVALLAAWLIALSPWHVHLSRWAIIPTVVPTMTALTLLLLVWAVRRRSARGIVAAGLVAGFTVAGYHAMKLYVPLLLGAVAAVYARTLARMNREALAYAAVVFLIIAGPILYLTVRDPGGGARLAQTSVFRAREVDALVLARQYLAYFSPRFLFVAGDGDPMHTPAGAGVAPWATLPLLVAGLVWLGWAALRPAPSWTRGAARLLLLALVLYPAPGMLTVPTPHTLRAAHLLPLLALIGGVGGVALWDCGRRLLAPVAPAVRWGAAAAVLAAGALALGELAGRYHHYFTAYPRAVARHFQYGLREALAYARAHEQEYDEIWVTDANQPYIYVLFFSRWPPSDVHRHLVVRRDPPAFNEVQAIGRYRFGPLPDTTAAALAPLFTVFDPAGRAAYTVRGGAVDGRRLLFIHRP
jgi:4-amino-4-deoxy-L-arabinose transferase-like glycosyltransferase